MKESTQKLYEERLLRVLAFIQRNLDEELLLEDLAREAYFSPYHFHRSFAPVATSSLIPPVFTIRTAEI